MDAGRVRKTFLDYFAGKGHEIVPSAPMVIKDDPTLMFTNAGMNQFKDVFLGTASRRDKRVADTQKCLRVSGKHNDLDEVGVDTYHHTMFEMLGNWSFGDYFKKEAIAWAWELLVEVYRIDRERLYVTVCVGDPQDGIARDDESREYWKQHIAEERILECGKEDNFWEMGDTGPCGPCSEIHIDLRGDGERAVADGKTLVNKGHPEVIEIWNLVFIEFNRLAGGRLESLPERHVDTGMGFERLCRVLQGKKSNYDTDVFTPLIGEIEKFSGKKYGGDQGIDIAMRVIADHLRAVAFSIGDGQLPYRDGAGYVIRRILRRAVRYGYSFLDLREPAIYRLSPVLAEQMKDQFPELTSRKDTIQNIIKEEEASFLRTLEQGMKKLQSVTGALSGAQAFELYDTFGFPIDLTRLIAREKGFTVDMEGFEAEMDQQRSRARAASGMETGDWVAVHQSGEETFIGYDRTEAEVKITKYRKVAAKGETFYQLRLDQTPFYPEGGGQVGDTGALAANGDEVEVFDTKRENNQILHYCSRLPKDPFAVFRARIDVDRRRKTENNHSATHLVHAALRAVLGPHVEQRGSLVNADHLRFDFSHFSKVDARQLAEIERLVNEKIRQGIPLSAKEMPIEEAKALGAMALFGEKYGDVVRVVIFDERYSVELCGGTHVKSTGSIGQFKIILETSVASGIRRIEALTGEAARARGGAQEERLHAFYAGMDRAKTLFEESKAIPADENGQSVERLEGLVARITELKLPEQIKRRKELQGASENPADVENAISAFNERNQQLSRQLTAAKKRRVSGLKEALQSRIREADGVNFLIERVDLDGGSMKDLAFQLKGGTDNLFLVFGGVYGDKALLTVVISESLIRERGLDAGRIVREIAAEIEGGGGGQPFFATAGGKKVEGIGAALEKARKFCAG